MTYQISFSGGLGSGISALIANENGLDFNLIFADTLIEDEDLYRFNADIARVCGKEIIHLVDGRTPWDVYVDNRWIGNTRTAHCSTELKTKPVRKWLEENADPMDPLVLGMDWSEMDRIERAVKNWAPRPVVSLLNEFKVSRADYDSILHRHGIEKPRLYRLGWEHNNCGGFCCKAGQVQFERLYRFMPERYQWHEEQMIIATDAIGPTAKPFLRRTGSWWELTPDVRESITELHERRLNASTEELNEIDAKIASLKLIYMSLKDFREHINSGTAELDMFSGAGCGCFTDEDAA